MAKLVIAREAVPGLIVDYRYATENNVAQRPLYPEGSDMLITEPMVHPLRRVVRWLAHMQLQLVALDAYRTPAVQGELRKICSDEQYVLEDSNHVRGIAIDATLADRRGTYLDMGTDFDDFSKRAHRDFQDLTTSQRQNRLTLDTSMQLVGFIGWTSEWWHFDYTR